MTAYIAYDNKIPLGTVSAAETPGFEKENAFDWFTYTWWQPGGGGEAHYQIVFDEPVTANYFSLAAFKIYDPDNPGVNNVKLQYFFDGQFLDVLPVYIPENNRPILQIFDSQTSDTWRFVFNTLVPVIVGVLSFGEILALPEGIKPAFTPPQWGHDDKITSVLSQTGQFLGRSVERYGLKHNITQTQVDPEWMAENWLPLAAGIRANPFFYSWNHEEYPEDVVYSWLDDKLPNPIYTSPIYTDFTLKCKALYDSE